MLYIAISEEDILTLKAAEIQQKRFEKMGIKSEVCALVPVDKINEYGVSDEKVSICTCGPNVATSVS